MMLKGRVAVITGAARGIGAAFAVGYAKEGARVVVADTIDGSDTVNKVSRADHDTASLPATLTRARGSGRHSDIFGERHEQLYHRPAYFM